MAELRVDPPRWAAARCGVQRGRRGTGRPAEIAPAPPAGSDPVSVAAANRAAVNSAKLSAHLAGGIKRLAEGAQAVTAALNGYVVTDEAGAAEITGGTAAAAAGAAISAINIPSPPVVEVPNVPVDVPAALASVPADPATVDDALTTGAGAGGLEGHAAAWDGVAAQLRTIGGEFRTLGSSLPASWRGLLGQIVAAVAGFRRLDARLGGSGQLACIRCSPIGRVSS
ncbi:PPE family protein [Mycobacterium xenopi 4042]|uniref:PPE family protein n=1 Tax=Mycobacterium xenopi 4042 TaxID=1299334 RepID=X7ZDR0_MYCXE|nr:PPE family protein [Mycobacterium xenopi 4042]